MACARYSDGKDFETEFAEILNQYLKQSLSMATSKEVLNYIGQMGISKVQQLLSSLRHPPLPLSWKTLIHPRVRRRVNS